MGAACALRWTSEPTNSDHFPSDRSPKCTGFDEASARGRTPAEWNIRYNALIEYWVIVPALVHNRDLWKPFLARNGMNVKYGHSANVSSAEAELQKLLKDHPPRPDWPDAADKLRLAYIKERSVTGEFMFGRRDPVSFTPRNSACPPPAVANSGTWAPTRKAALLPPGLSVHPVQNCWIMLQRILCKAWSFCRLGTMEPR